MSHRQNIKDKNGTNTKYHSTKDNQEKMYQNKTPLRQLSQKHHEITLITHANQQYKDIYSYI